MAPGESCDLLNFSEYDILFSIPFTTVLFSELLVQFPARTGNFGEKTGRKKRVLEQEMMMWLVVVSRKEHTC